MTIINETTYHVATGTTFGFEWSHTIIVFIFFILSGIMIYFIWHTRPKITKTINIITFSISIIFTIIILSLDIILTPVIFIKSTYEELPEYTIQLDDTISFNEFYNNYEIIKQQGENIYIVHKK